MKSLDNLQVTNFTVNATKIEGTKRKMDLSLFLWSAIMLYGVLKVAC